MRESYPSIIAGTPTSDVYNFTNGAFKNILKYILSSIKTENLTSANRKMETKPPKQQHDREHFMFIVRPTETKQKM